MVAFKEPGGLVPLRIAAPGDTFLGQTRYVRLHTGIGGGRSLHCRLNYRTAGDPRGEPQSALPGLNTTQLPVERTATAIPIPRRDRI